MLVSVFGIYFNIFEILLLVLLTFYLPLALMNSKGKIGMSNPKLFNVFLFAFGFYLCFLLLSIIGAQNESQVLKSFLKWCEILSLSMLIFFYVHNLKNFKKIYWIFWLSSFGFIAVILLNIFLSKNSLFADRIFPGYPSAFALALILPFAKRKNKLSIIVTLFCFLSALISLSRGVWIILLIFSILILRNTSFKKKVFALSFATVFIGVLVWRTPLDDIIEARIHSKASNIERLGMANIALRAFVENPITGIGSLNFPDYFMSNANRSMIRSEQPELLEPHNVFLQIAAEEGVFALFSFGVLIFIIYYVVFNVSKSLTTSNDLRPYLTGLKYLTIVITVNLLFGFISDQFRLVYASYFGLSLSILRLKIKDEKRYVFSQ